MNQDNKKLSYRKQIARQQRTHRNNSKFSRGGSRGGSIFETSGGSRYRKYKFKCEIGLVFHGG